MSTTLLVSIGIPGSGKTTFLKPFAEQHNFVYISPDSLREELTGDAVHQSEDARVWKIVEYATEKSLSDGKSVVIDATFTNTRVRNAFIEIARKEKAETVGMLFDVSLETALERNAQRERVVPEYVIEKMHTRLS
ncbi:MAG: hypothetical protein RLZZ76_343 [Candidatus Parcubacteria bacterium]|jgi:predicted kinase